MYVDFLFYVGLWEEVADERVPDSPMFGGVTVPPKGSIGYLSASKGRALSDDSVWQAFWTLARIPAGIQG
jgi:hypothetical protein